MEIGGRVENLTPWKKGYAPNPKGRPKGTISLTAMLQKMLQQKITSRNLLESEEGKKIDGRKNKKTIGEEILSNLLFKALSGEGKDNLAAIQTVINRIEGDPLKTIKTEAKIDVKKLSLEELKKIVED